MASITIRNLNDDVRTRLQVRAAGNDRSMEQEVRLILREAVGSGAVPEKGLGTAIYELFTRQLHYVAPQLAYTVHPASSARVANTGSFSVCATTRKAPLRRVGHRHPL